MINNQSLTPNKINQPQIKFQNNNSHHNIINLKNKSEEVRSKARPFVMSQESKDIGLPKKKKLEDISGGVYLTFIADQRQDSNLRQHKKQIKKDKQTQPITTPAASKIPRPPQKNIKPVINQSKPIKIIGSQVKLQEQQSKSIQFPRKPHSNLNESLQAHNEFSSLNDEVINQCLIWKCPCGVDMFGPIEYFNHIQVDHKDEPLETVIYKKTLQKMFDNYPNFTLGDLEIVEQAQDLNFQKQINKVMSKHEHYFKSNEIKDLDALRNRGTYADMAFTFIQKLQLKGQEYKMIVHFFNFLKFYVDENISKKQWSQEPPNEILKYGNNIITFFLKHKQQYKPFRSQDIRQLFYVLSNWMFMNHWTNDRIFYQVDQNNLKEEQEENESDQQKKEEEEEG